ncbi:hypothetical protein BH09DEP1_BH09DEP1_3120 [soil metagenome]
MKYISFLFILVGTFAIALEKNQAPAHSILGIRKLSKGLRLPSKETICLRLQLLDKILNNDTEAAIDLLDNKKVNPNKAVAPYPTPLIQAINQETDAFVPILFKYANPDKYCWSISKYPIFEAIRLGKIDVLKLFIEKNANLECTDSNFDTPLTYACSNFSPNINSLQIIMVLMQGGAKVHHQNEHRQTALHLICTKDLFIAEQLIAAGANINSLDRFKQTPLVKVVLAMSDSNNSTRLPQLIATANLLLSKGADPDHTNKKGYSARSAAQETNITWIDFPPIKEPHETEQIIICSKLEKLFYTHPGHSMDN